MAEQESSAAEGQSARRGLAAPPAGSHGVLLDGLSFTPLDANGVPPFPRSPKLQRKIAIAAQPSQVNMLQPVMKQKNSDGMCAHEDKPLLQPLLHSCSPSLVGTWLLFVNLPLFLYLLAFCVFVVVFCRCQKKLSISQPTKNLSEILNNIVRLFSRPKYIYIYIYRRVQLLRCEAFLCLALQ